MYENLEQKLEALAGQLARLSVILEQVLEETLKRAPRPRQPVLPLSQEGLPNIALVWNKWAAEKLPRVSEMSPASQRYKNAVARWKEKPNEDYWVKVINRMNRSAFCLGENPRNWLADIEFLCRPDTHSRLLEGKYDDKTKGSSYVPRVEGYVTIEGKRVEVLK